MRVSVRHIESGGIGYNQGYTTLEGFFSPPEEVFSALPFLDLRGHVFDDGHLAANAGLGVRKRWGERIYGINSYYDYRNTNRQHYNQASLGFETLGKRWDVRLNGYLPVGDKKSHSYQHRFDHFSGHRMYIRRKYEFALKGVDAEAGVHFGKIKNFDFYSAAGPYYFSGPLGKHAWGGKARITGSYKNYIGLEISNSYDNVFNNNFQGQLTLSYPFGPKLFRKKHKHSSSCALDVALVQRMVQPVDREEIVVLNTHHKKSVAINPATGKPYVFWFVNNQSHSNGTFESPFTTLVAAQTASSPYDIIYVYPGDGRTTGLSAITLQNNQKLWGTGVNQYLKTTAGKIKIPVLAAGYPMLGSGFGNSVITCANNNEISGVLINNATLVHGIYCNAVTNALIQNNVVISNLAATQTLFFNNCAGNITIKNNQFQIKANTDALFIASSTPSETSFFISNNQFLGTPGLISSAAIQWGSIDRFNSIEITSNVFSNLGSPSGEGSTIGIFGAPGSAGFVGAGRLTLANNTFTGSGSQNSPNRGTVNIPVLAGGNIAIDVVNNKWVNAQNGTGSLSITNYNTNSTTCLKMSGNTSDASAAFGGFTGSYFLNIGGVAGSNFTANINDNNLGVFAINNLIIGNCN